MIYHSGSCRPAAEADIAGLSWVNSSRRWNSDEEDSEFESAAQRAYFASVEQD